MNLLSIGNSFSQDAHKWLHRIAQSRGVELRAVNLYIGGCSLERHWENFLTGEAAYDLEINGEKAGKISIQDALTMEKWDAVTLQQASRVSGDPGSYEPWLTGLAAEVCKACPGARLLIHQTWAYEVDFDHEWFEPYGHDQARMHRQLTAAYGSAAAGLGCGVIPVGEVVAQIRESCPGFDYRQGGLSLNRDGFHLSHLYGRYAAALTWFGFLTGEDVGEVAFVPEWEGERADPALLRQINAAAAEVLNRKYHTL